MLNSIKENTLVALWAKGNLDEAEQLANLIVSSHPANSLAWRVLAAISRAKGDTDTAVVAIRRAVESDPNNPETLTNLGVILKEAGELDEAERVYRRVLVQSPDYSEAHNNLGNVLRELERFTEACDSFQKAISLNPNYVESHHNLGITLQKSGRLEEAIESYHKAIDLNPCLYQAMNDLGTCFQILGRVEMAHTSYQQAIQVRPDYFDAYTNLCDLLEKLGRIDEGITIVKTAIEKISGRRSELLLTHGQLLYRKRDYSKLGEILNSICISDLPEKRKISYLHLKANWHHALQEYTAAYHSFEEMNKQIECSKEYLKFNGNELFESLRSRINMLTNYRARSIENKLLGEPVVDPVFLIGFPRSGTTLLDTILRTHTRITVVEEQPMVEKATEYLNSIVGIDSTGQFDIKTLKEARNVYIEELKKHADINVGDVIVDKLPLNILELPIVSQLFPRSRYILALRHPLDCILSCWMQNFQLNRAMVNMSNLNRIAELYDYAMQIAVLCETKFSLEMHRVRYEDLVTHFDTMVSHILNFLNLPWEEGIRNYRKTAIDRGLINTPSYSQVVEPIYTSAVYRWQRYDNYLEAVADRLRPFIIEHGYEELEAGFRQ